MTIKFYFLALIFILISSCSILNKEEEFLLTPKGVKIKLRLAVEETEQRQGLSGLSPVQFSKDEGMLFVYHQMAPRRFWMPDTYFDLDIIFLSPDLTILHIEKNVPHHPGRQEPPPIPITATYIASHILEIRSDSPLALEMKIGEKLIWQGSRPLLEIKPKIHQQK